jgi:hypothetical protein
MTTARTKAESFFSYLRDEVGLHEVGAVVRNGGENRVRARVQQIKLIEARRELLQRNVRVRGRGRELAGLCEVITTLKLCPHTHTRK